MTATTRTRETCSTDSTLTQAWTGGKAQWQSGGLARRHVQVFLHGQHAPSLRRGQQGVTDVVPLFRLGLRHYSGLCLRRPNVASTGSFLREGPPPPLPQPLPLPPPPPPMPFARFPSPRHDSLPPLPRPSLPPLTPSFYFPPTSGTEGGSSFGNSKPRSPRNWKGRWSKPRAQTPAPSKPSTWTLSSPLRTRHRLLSTLFPPSFGNCGQKCVKAMPGSP